MKIAFHTLGCKVNQYESEAMAARFREHGHEIVDEKDFADAYIINTCTVTAVADKKSRQYIRRMKKVNPDSIVAVTGCYAQIEPEEVSAIKGVDIVTGTNEKHTIVDMVEDAFNRSSASSGEHASARTEEETLVHPYEELGVFEELGTVASTDSRTRAYIKIQEGCNRFCTYCVIPYARGPVRSRAIDDIVTEAKALLAKGYKELVLTGINTAQYDMEGRDLYIGSRQEQDAQDAKVHSGGADSEVLADNNKLPDEIFGIEKVIAAVNDIPGDFRIRLSSLEPAVVNAEYVKRLFKYDKLCHHLHMSAQSGSDKILKAMNRPYDLDHYYEMANALFDFDDCYGISTDIIVGFPGEKEADFQASADLVKECSFCKTHIFKYSKRPKTQAAEMKEQVSPQIKNERASELERIARASTRVFHEINMAAAVEGRTERVLVEELADGDLDSPSGYYTGYTGNYIRTYIPYSEKLAVNEFVTVRLLDVHRDGMIGEVAE